MELFIGILSRLSMGAKLDMATKIVGLSHLQHSEDVQLQLTNTVKMSGYLIFLLGTILKNISFRS